MNTMQLHIRKSIKQLAYESNKRPTFFISAKIFSKVICLLKISIEYA